MPNPWNNPYIPGDPFSYDLKWLVRRIKEHDATLQQILDEMPDESDIKQIIQQMIDDGEITALALQSVGVFNVKDYGAKGDQITDDTDAIRAAYAAAVAAAGILYFPAGTYLTTSTLEFPDPLTVMMEGTIYSPISDVIVKVGSDTEATWGYKQNWKIEGMSGINSGSIGLVLQNITSSAFYLDWIKKMETSVVCYGNAKGFQNNIVQLGEITENTIGLVLDSDNGGWVNDNLFIGGRFTKFSSIPSSTGVVITSEDGYYQNNNVFLKPNVESCDVGFDIQYGTYNHIYEARFESTTIGVQYGNSSTYNTVEAGYGNPVAVPMLNQQKGSRFNWGFNKDEMKFQTLGSFIDSSACNATHGSIADVVAIQTSSGNIQYLNAGLKYTLDGDYINLAGTVYAGVVVDLKGDGNAVLYWDAIMKNVAPNNTRGVFIMYAADGSVISTAPTFFPGQSASAYTVSNTTFFRYSSNALGYSFIVPDTVDHVFIGFEIKSPGESLKSMIVGSNIPYSIRRHGLTLSTIPTSTNAPAGQIVTQSNGGAIWIWNPTSSTWSVNN